MRFYQTNAYLSYGVIDAILIQLNKNGYTNLFISSPTLASFDVPEGKNYSLDEATQKVMTLMTNKQYLNISNKVQAEQIAQNEELFNKILETIQWH